MQPLEIKCRLQVLKPAHEVFEAIVDPAQMANYFISKGTGRLEEGATPQWEFPEFEGSYPVRGGRMEPGRFVSFYWDTEGKEYLVEITLEASGPDRTIVTVTEKGGQNDEAGMAWLKNNTEGWANFLACLKAWMEYGINLRKGAFDFLGNN